MKCYKYTSKIGNLYISADDNYLYSISCCQTKETGTNYIIKETVKQLDEYFALKRKVFDIPLNIKGTNFQKQVWKELLKIPYGEIRTYKDIATSLGNPNSSRAVGNANNKNPIIIVIPCHRVIGRNGNLRGYAPGVDKKEILLKLEKAFNLVSYCSTD